MIAHDEIEALEKTIQRWRAFVEHGQEALRSLEDALQAMKRATLERPVTSPTDAPIHTKTTRTKRAQPGPFKTKYSRPSHELALEFLVMDGRPATAPQIQRALKKQGQEFTVQALTHGLRKLMDEGKVKKRKSGGRVTYKATTPRAPRAQARNSDEDKT